MGTVKFAKPSYRWLRYKQKKAEVNKPRKPKKFVIVAEPSTAKVINTNCEEIVVSAPPSVEVMEQMPIQNDKSAEKRLGAIPKAIKAVDPKCTCMDTPSTSAASLDLKFCVKDHDLNSKVYKFATELEPGKDLQLELDKTIKESKYNAVSGEETAKSSRKIKKEENPTRKTNDKSERGLRRKSRKKLNKTDEASSSQQTNENENKHGSETKTRAGRAHRKRISTRLEAENCSSDAESKDRHPKVGVSRGTNTTKRLGRRGSERKTKSHNNSSDNICNQREQKQQTSQKDKCAHCNCHSNCRSDRPCSSRANSAIKDHIPNCCCAVNRREYRRSRIRDSCITKNQSRANLSPRTRARVSKERVHPVRYSEMRSSLSPKNWPPKRVQTDQIYRHLPALWEVSCGMRHHSTTEYGAAISSSYFPPLKTSPPRYVNPHSYGHCIGRPPGFNAVVSSNTYANINFLPAQYRNDHSMHMNENNFNGKPFNQTNMDRSDYNYTEWTSKRENIQKTASRSIYLPRTAQSKVSAVQKRLTIEPNKNSAEQTKFSSTAIKRAVPEYVYYLSYSDNEGEQAAKDKKDANALNPNKEESIVEDKQSLAAAVNNEQVGNENNVINKIVTTETNEAYNMDLAIKTESTATEIKNEKVVPAENIPDAVLIDEEPPIRNDIQPEINATELLVRNTIDTTDPYSVDDCPPTAAPDDTDAVLMEVVLKFKSLHLAGPICKAPFILAENFIKHGPENPVATGVTNYNPLKLDGFKTDENNLKPLYIKAASTPNLSLIKNDEENKKQIKGPKAINAITATSNSKNNLTDEVITKRDIIKDDADTPVTEVLPTTEQSSQDFAADDNEIDPIIKAVLPTPVQFSQHVALGRGFIQTVAVSKNVQHCGRGGGRVGFYTRHI